MLTNVEKTSDIENKMDDELNNSPNVQHIPMGNDRQRREITELCKIVNCDRLSIDGKLTQLDDGYSRSKNFRNTMKTRRKRQIIDTDRLNIANLFSDSDNHYYNNQNLRRAMSNRRKRQIIDTGRITFHSTDQSDEVIRHKRQIIDPDRLTIVPTEPSNE